MEQRLMAMCNNHAMFHFLFDREGNLLAANKRAMENMKGMACRVTCNPVV
jgi:hypothetical protein